MWKKKKRSRETKETGEATLLLTQPGEPLNKAAADVRLQELA